MVHKQVNKFDSIQRLTRLMSYFSKDDRMDGLRFIGTVRGQ